MPCEKQMESPKILCKKHAFFHLPTSLSTFLQLMIIVHCLEPVMSIQIFPFWLFNTFLSMSVRGREKEFIEGV